jgi:uncharacterized protein (TIGR00255 family)
MTGYAYREKTGQELSITIEVKGYNNRYLEIFVNMPPWLAMFESKIRDKISACCGRGKVEVYIRIREHNVPVKITVNKNAARAYYNAMNDLAKELGLKEKPSLAALLGMDSLQSSSVLEIEKNRDNENYWQEIQPLFDEAMFAFCGEREREGKHTKDDILSNIAIIETSLNSIISFVPVIEQTIKDNIKSRFSELLGNQIDENKVLAETASLLLKYTISEEISRLTSHLNEFKKETEINQRPGKKLDFLCQELNREINTIGSKSAIIEVTSEVVKMKETLENIREQLRNIE